MKNITLTGAVGDEIEISYQDGKLVVKLSEHGFAVDFTDAVIKAMKKDANAFLYAAQLIYRGDYSGEHYAKRRIAEVVKATFDAIKAPEKKPATTANVDQKEPTAKQSVTTEKKEVEQQPKAVEEPKVADKPVATEKKATTTATASEKKTTTTTAKKTSTTSTKKSK